MQVLRGRVGAGSVDLPSGPLVVHAGTGCCKHQWDYPRPPAEWSGWGSIIFTVALLLGRAGLLSVGAAIGR